MRRGECRSALWFHQLIVGWIVSLKNAPFALMGHDHPGGGVCVMEVGTRRAVVSAARTACFGALLFAGTASASLAADPPSPRALYTFSDFARPIGGLAIDKSGALFGATPEGGSKGCAGVGCGAVIKLSPPKRGGGRWQHEQIHVFSAEGGSDGVRPSASVVVGPDGSVYGTTLNGGGGKDRLCKDAVSDFDGCGTVFRLKKKGGKWVHEVLHAFKGGADGAYPEGLLAVDGAGAVYGTTREGGKCGLAKIGCGIAYKISPPGKGRKSWTKSTIHAFDPDRRSRQFGLLLAPDGTLVGTTETGVVYRLSPRGKRWAYSVAFDFSTSRKPKPRNVMAIDGAGNLYGTGGGNLFRLKAPARPAGPWQYEMIETFDDARYGAYGTPAVNDAGAVFVAAHGNEIVELLPPLDGTREWRQLVAADFGRGGALSITLGKGGRLFGIGSFKKYVAFEVAP